MRRINMRWALSKKLVFLKGYKLLGPAGMAYELLDDLFESNVGDFSLYRPLGGAPDPVGGKRMPRWLVDQIKKEMDDGR